MCEVLPVVAEDLGGFGSVKPRYHNKTADQTPGFDDMHLGKNSVLFACHRPHVYIWRDCMPGELLT